MNLSMLPRTAAVLNRFEELDELHPGSWHTDTVVADDLGMDRVAVRCIVAALVVAGRLARNAEVFAGCRITPKGRRALEVTSAGVAR